ncbi:MAG: response regulator transcription factor [Sphingobacteriales bacterium]|nr:MAG: response regulator transcription factor [Sphingobacteriales bacterium]
MPARKVRCLLVDDETAAHYVLVNYIERIDRLELVGQCHNVLEAMNFLRNNPVDLIFLDINMPELTGFDLLRTVNTPPPVILTTAYSEFALESYDFGAIDYLLKPITFPRFLKAVERFLTNWASSNESTNTEEVDTTFMVKADGNWIRIDPKDVLYAQSLGNYVKVFTSKQNHLISITTAELEQKLPANNFMRIHKSYIVAIDKVKRYNNQTVVVNDAELPVGITYRRELAERMK